MEVKFLEKVPVQLEGWVDDQLEGVGVEGLRDDVLLPLKEDVLALGKFEKLLMLRSTR